MARAQRRRYLDDMLPSSSAVAELSRLRDRSAAESAPPADVSSEGDGLRENLRPTLAKKRPMESAGAKNRCVKIQRAMARMEARRTL